PISIFFILKFLPCYGWLSRDKDKSPDKRENPVFFGLLSSAGASPPSSSAPKTSRFFLVFRCEAVLKEKKFFVRRSRKPQEV
ncbi:MAG: hypothetical protein IKI63_07190, partial [Clostridia bacterium]|nr:hypothetical protein [Clostridia bacterium]